MHTFKLGKDIINYNSDYSGNVIIHNGKESIEVSADILFAFTADMIRNKKIGELENTTVEEILFGKNEKKAPEEINENMSKFINYASHVISNKDKEFEWNELSLINRTNESADEFQIHIKYNNLIHISNLLIEIDRIFSKLFKNDDDAEIICTDDWCYLANYSFSICLAKNEIILHAINEKETFITLVMEFIVKCFQRRELQIYILKDNSNDIDIQTLVNCGIKSIDIDVIDGTKITKFSTKQLIPVQNGPLYSITSIVDNFSQVAFKWLSTQTQHSTNYHFIIQDLKKFAVVINSSDILTSAICPIIRNFGQYLKFQVRTETNKKQIRIYDDNTNISISKKEILISTNNQELYQQFAFDIIYFVKCVFKNQRLDIIASPIAFKHLMDFYADIQNTSINIKELGEIPIQKEGKKI